MNGVTITSPGTGNPVVFQATGSDANIILEFEPKGTGVIEFSVARQPLRGSGSPLRA